MQMVVILGIDVCVNIPLDPLCDKWRHNVTYTDENVNLLTWNFAIDV